MTVRKWTEISRDPNDPSVLAFRQELLANARRRDLIKNRNAYLCALAKDKSVMDIGVVEHFHASSMAETWLHKQLCSAAKTCLGVDILEADIAKLRSQGYNVIVHDITAGSLPQKFDLIVAGDVLEHLNDPAALLSNAARMLGPQGRLVLSTPNPWYANAVLKNCFEGLPFTDSADHVAWFDPSTLCELASRAGLALASYAGVMAERSASLRSRCFSRLAPLLMGFGIRRELFAKTMVYEFVLNDEAG